MQVWSSILALFNRQPPIAEIVEAMPAPVRVKVKADLRMLHIKKIAAARLARAKIDDDWLKGLSERTQTWLGVLTTQMLLLVITSPEPRLSDHVAGRRAIRGLLAADQLSIDAYVEATKPKRPSLADVEGRRSGGGPKRSIGGMKM